MLDEGYAEDEATGPRSSDILSLVASNHAQLARRIGLDGISKLVHTKGLDAGVSAEQFAALHALDVKRRQDLAYLLMLSLPTPALSELQGRLTPLIAFDLITLLPQELVRSIFAHLDVASVIRASLVCRAWSTRIFDDQLLWRALYEQTGWGFDAEAVEWWNTQLDSPTTDKRQKRASHATDEGMEMDEDETAQPPEWLLPPPRSGAATPDLSGRVSPTFGLPPSPRHSNWPPLRSSPTPTPYQDADMAAHGTSTLRASTRTMARNTHGFQAMGIFAPQRAAPMGFDPCRVSKVHFDKEGKPWVSWYHLYACRSVIEYNWRHGLFELHEMQKPELRFLSTGPPPPSFHPVGAPHADGVYAIQFDGDRLVAGLRGGLAICYDLRTGQQVRQYRFHTGSVLCLQYDTPETKVMGTPDRLVTGSSDGHAVVWELDSGKLLHDLHGHTQSVLSVRFNTDTLATCSKDRQILLWSMSSGEMLRTLEGHRSAVNALSFKGGLVASASGDRDVRIWDPETGECKQVLTGHIGGIAALAFDGRYVVTGSSDSTVRVVDIETGLCDVEIGTADVDRQPAPPGREGRQPGAPMTLFAAGNTPGLQPILGHAHQELVRTLAFDPRFIVTGSYDETIKVWDRKTGLLIIDIHAHSTRVFNLQFDVSRIISCSQAGIDEVRIIDFLPGVDTSFLKP